MKIGMICKYEGGQSLSRIAHDLGYVVSTVNNNVKQDACRKDHMNFNFHLIRVHLSLTSVFNVTVL
jgi:hypothetical protein